MIYSLIVTFFYPILLILQIFPGVRKYFNARRESLKKLREISKGKGNKYWFHASSVGELDQTKAISKIIKKYEPDSEIYVSVYSLSVKEKNFNDSNIHLGFFLPFDHQFAYNVYFKLIKPKALIIVAWDTWPNLIRTAKRFGVKTFLSCGSLHKKSSRLKFPQKRLTEKTLELLDGISPSSEERINLFQKHAKGVKIHTPGDSRFDSVIEKIENRKNPPTLPKTNNKVIVFASTYNICDNLLFPNFQKFLEEGYDLWLFPHKIDENRLKDIQNSLNKMNIPFEYYSKLTNTSPRIILFDKLGILAFAYERATYCYVGGAFHHRVHNVLEPAYFGLPILTGPRITHAPEALELELRQGLFRFNTSEEFYSLHRKITESARLKAINQLNSSFVQSGKGYSEKFYLKFLKDNE
ncbi:MAG: hypothetical protein KDK36_13535 [Leptospiraceae bacterium]|nr:hypothetical protein [Leptospiraceae bacterium]